MISPDVLFECTGPEVLMQEEARAMFPFDGPAIMDMLLLLATMCRLQLAACSRQLQTLAGATRLGHFRLLRESPHRILDRHRRGEWVPCEFPHRHAMPGPWTCVNIFCPTGWIDVGEISGWHDGRGCTSCCGCTPRHAIHCAAEPGRLQITECSSGAVVTYTTPCSSTPEWFH